MDVPTIRRPRADALRNRRRLIDAAVAVFAEHGLDVAVAEIARRAEVGTATLFRNFPTKDDLIYAVIEARVTELLEVGRRALEVDDPGAAFEQFLIAVAELQIRDRGFFEAIHSRLIDEPELMQCKAKMSDVGEQILARAQAAGAVREDVGPEDLRFLICAAAAHDGHHERYLRILLDGLRPAGASALPG
ncbi:MAG: TetR/AcrR family transcriptional regulator [Actinomycetota bacterium]|nr:TetR/AcrR family transcriptional regulator [Actinomycetota bacterium]